jgi:hypothetical protein
MKKIEMKRREAKRAAPAPAPLSDREIDVVAGGYGNINAF